MRVVIDVNLNYPGGRLEAVRRTTRLIGEIGEGSDTDSPPQDGGGQYVVAELTPMAIRRLAELDRESTDSPGRAIFHIWPDFEVRALLDKSVATVKADAARTAFAASGIGICWAVLDTGVDVGHPHFSTYKNLDGGLEHLDFTGSGDGSHDANGHGTHVAGIIAGTVQLEPPRANAVRFERDENNKVGQRTWKLAALSGIAPQCKLVSYKVLDDNGNGRTSNILSALQHIQEVNDYGRMPKIHGVNLSLGYDFDPEWFACGQSPLCIEVNRLVRSGVVVVVAAGNTGYAYSSDALQRRSVAAGRALTINDPGNADLAITVGSTHRDMPHLYGVSYFSSKGPTGDGRAKPDLVAPGERILSAATGTMRDAAAGDGTEIVDYVESSGTSMAAPHVSGVIAAFLSIRSEFVGYPERVKEIFTSTATDLGRVRDFQGSGLIDAMRAIQSV